MHCILSMHHPPSYRETERIVKSWPPYLCTYLSSFTLTQCLNISARAWVPESSMLLPLRLVREKPSIRSIYCIHEIFHCIKNFAKPSYLGIAEKFGGKNFVNAVIKGTTSSMQSLTQVISSMIAPLWYESRWWNWQNFLRIHCI